MLHQRASHEHHNPPPSPLGSILTFTAYAVGSISNDGATTEPFGVGSIASVMFGVACRVRV